MYRILTWAGIAVLLLGCVAEPSSRKRPGHRPAPPPALAQAFAFLDSGLTRTDRDTLRRWLPDSAIKFHFSVGLWLRNEAGLWQGGPIADSLRSHGLRHPDDMSDLILRAYGLYLRGDSVNLDSLVRTVPLPPQGYEVLPVATPPTGGTSHRAAP